ncbi:MAG: hypothetical protein HY291_21910 [Planctomycetes bacterium]|nr:hypothetical protein [Planctomycetota bacterium]
MAAVTSEGKRILIEGDLVRLERTVVEREATTTDFLAELARTQPVDSGFLPEGCVLFSRACDENKRTRTIYLIERPPGLQVVQYNAVRGGHEANELTLSWPRTLWFCRTSQAPSAECAAIQDLWLTATRTPVLETGHDTPLFRLPMPNIYEEGNGALCMGNLSLEETKAPAGVRVTALIRQVLESAWNGDLLPSFEGLAIKSLEDWALASGKDPEFHAQLELKQHLRAHVGEMLKFLAEHPG